MSLIIDHKTGELKMGTGGFLVDLALRGRTHRTLRAML